MKGEIVSVTTKDCLRLHGLYCPTSQRPLVSPQRGSVDAAVLLHGLAGNFYSSRLLFCFAETLQRLGVNVVVVNTRGHDMINTSTWGGKARSVGAALENIDDCRLDVNAWVEFLIEGGAGNVLLFGHSLGAIKALYAQAHAPHPKVGSIVGLSATRLSYEKLIGLPSGDLFRETLNRCENLIEADRGDDPIQVPFPFPTWMTPRCYLDKYGPGDKFNWMSFVERITIPTLLTFGGRELEENPAFVGMEEGLHELKQGWNSLTIETVADADHFYTSKFSELEDLITRWLTN
jgi:pimeloyl-ACP methyl ester carboxylesterase